MKRLSWTWLFVPGLLLNLILAGCSSGESNGNHEEYLSVDGRDGDGGILFCDDDSDCAQDMECRGGVCSDIVSCSCNHDCGDRDDGLICNPGSHNCEEGATSDISCSDGCDCFANEVCSVGQCVPEDKVCSDDEDCEEGQTCIERACVREECSSRADCEDSVCLVCIQNKCAAPPPICQLEDDCCVGYHCNFGVCVPDSEGCQSDADCPNLEFPRCVPPDCVPECLSDVDCGAQVCIDRHCVSPGCTPESCGDKQWCNPEAAEGLGACEPGCDSHLDCNPGQLCDYDHHVCIQDCCGGCPQEQVCDTVSCSCQEKCTQDEDCLNGYACDTETGECFPQGAGEGEPCGVDYDCDGDLLCDNCENCVWMEIPASMTCRHVCNPTEGGDCPLADRECKGPRRFDMKFLCIPPP